jgi:hypothetical protein
MTYAQEQQWRKLQDNIKKAYDAFQKNTDKTKHDLLAKKWQESIAKEEKFTSKFY